MDLLIIAIFTAFSAATVGLASPPDALRIPLMLPLVFFTPGYSLTCALYPRREDQEPLARLGLSLAFSLAALPLVALALNYSPWGVRWEPLMAFVGLLVVLFCALGLLHRRLVPAGERFAPSLRLDLGAGAARRLSRAAVTTAVLSPFAALAAILLVLLAGQRSEAAPHTEFYLLGPDGRSASFPSRLMLGEKASLILGITNREGEERRYSVTALVNGAPVQELPAVLLGPSERWRRPVTLAPEQAGNRQLVQFDLHMDGVNARAYRTVYIWLDVLKPLAPPVEVLAEEQQPGPTTTPASTPAPTPAPAPPQPLLHRVARGENLSFIAALYDVPVEAVIAANPLPNPNLIFAQQEIIIPAGAGR